MDAIPEATRFQCGVCSKSYTMKNNLRRHQRVECGKEKTMVCHICEHRYYYKQELDTHLRMKHNMLFRPSKIWGVESIEGVAHATGDSANTTADLMRKQDAVKPDSNIKGFIQLFHCPQCRKAYKYKTTLNRHLKYECNQEPAFKCPYCLYACKQKYTLIATKRFACPSCSKRYLHQITLRSHQKYECGIEPQFGCQFCPMKFKLKENRFTCPKCGRKYKHKGNMTSHLKYECGKAPQFKCARCLRHFHQKSNMKKHQQNCSFQLICPNCGRNYKTKYSLLSHLKTRCGKQPSCRCHVCPYVAYRKYDLKKHLVVKTAVQCPNCQKMYRNKSTMKSHLSQECGKCYQCHMCSYTCKRRHSLKLHYYIKHN
ncbi:hypothetical protein HUJ05_009007 [Dendroctonus ponderosae]|nr:hypothetical protein HUJ05_009007 [Dendroctonus ponderosae]